MALFRKGYELTLNRVRDRIVIKEGGERLELTVNGDSFHMVAGLNNAQKKLKELPEDATDAQVKNAAEYFASVMFGNEQAHKLMQFYSDDPACVISVCGQYFKERLAGKIAKVQKKLKA